MRKQILSVTVAAALAVTVFAAVDQTTRGSKGNIGRSETVGGFAVKLASVIGIKAAGPEQAATSLKAAGVKLEADLGAPLTENRAARILSDLGVKVVPSAHPDSVISVGRADQLLHFANEAGVGIAGAPSPTPIPLPTECLELRNVGQCQSCCTAATNCGPNPHQSPFDCNVCAKFCQALLPTASQTEPGP